MKVCVIGSGLTGLTAAYRLSLQGNDVTVLEKEGFIGGMASSFSVGKDLIPKTYHHIMKFDDTTRGLVKELGLFGKYFDTSTKMGFYYDGKINKLSSPLDMLTFKPFSMESRLRFVSFAAKLMLINDWEKMEKVTAEKWIRREANEEIYQKIFKPLLKIKFSDDYQKIIARWVGERLKMRESSGPFGYVKGGIDQILQNMAQSIREKGGRIVTSARVVSLKRKGNSISEVIYKANGKKKSLQTDLVIYTAPLYQLPKIVKLPKNYTDRLRMIKYKSTLCAVIGFDKKLTDYYWINFVDGDYSFGGLILHSSLNPYLKSTKTVMYVFTYLNSTDQFWKMSDEKILQSYIKDIERVFPKASKAVKWKKLFRIEHSKPVYEVGYRKSRIGFKTPISNLLLGGIALFYPNVRNMGTAIDTGEKLAVLATEGIYKSS